MDITTDRLRIRPLQPADADDFYTYRSDPDIARYQGFDAMTDPAQARAFIEEEQGRLGGVPGEWSQWGIAFGTTNRLVGDCAVRTDTSDARQAELGITIAPAAQRNSYATEALRGLLRFLFAEQHLHRVIAITDVQNLASVQLLKRVGFRQEGHFIENVFLKGRWTSEFLFAVLQREWQARQKTTK